jgi:hypothetical protein
MVNSFPNGLTDSDIQLQQLVDMVQKHPIQSQERKQALNELVNVILRSHKLRSPSKLISPTAQQISLDLQHQLLLDVSEKINNYNPQRTPIKEWANSLRDAALKTILTDTIINRIAQEAQQALPGSKERRLLLNLLVEAIQITDGFSHPYRSYSSFSPDFYEYIYKEAIQETLLYICQHIDQYNPNHNVMAWVNFLLPKRFSDAQNKYMKQGITKLPKILRNITNGNQSEGRIVFFNNAETLERFWKKEEAVSSSQELRNFIEEDPDGVFSKAHIVGRPDVNFKVMMLEKVWGGKTWEYLAQQWQIDSIQTLSCFFNRSLKKFRPLFVKYLQD